MTPVIMITKPPNVSIHPITERPSKNSRPMPSRRGISDNPKALYPHSVQSPLVTVTRFRNRKPPAITSPRPKTNWPTPPGVPPAPRILSFSSICYCPVGGIFSLSFPVDEPSADLHSLRYVKEWFQG